MKKLKYLSMLLITIICLTGCSEKSPEKTLEDALAKMKEVKTFKSSIQMEVGSDLYSQVIHIDGEYAENTSHEKTKVSLAGNAGEEETYTLKKEGKFYVYSSINGKEWTYTVTDIEEDSSINSIENIASNYKSLKKVESDKKGYIKLEIVLDNVGAKEALGETGSMEGMDPTKDLIANIYIKDGYIAFMKMDLRNILTEDYAKDITKYSMNFEWSDYNKIDELAIPKEIIENAKLQEKEEE